MRITKEAGTGLGAAPDENELSLINAQSRRSLAAGDVYTFGVRLCDNDIDRDGERFPLETLEELAQLFVGKSGMFDHQWSAQGQTARIYRTEVVREAHSITGAGDPYCYLKGYAYMLRTEKNRDLIAEIEGGIKKEVSISCAVERAVCSICGEDIRDSSRCAHSRGHEYEGRLCWADLRGATDAYEWSFVAVPAQKNAGVMKSLIQRGGLQQLEQEAALGRKYLDDLRREVARMGGLADPDLDAGVRKTIAGKLEEAELLALRETYRRRLSEKFPLQTQLPYGGGEMAPEEQDGPFLI